MSGSKWDKYFYGVCEAVSKNSSCLSRQIGAVLVRDNGIISTAYNGPPRGIPHCDSFARRDYLIKKNKLSESKVSCLKNELNKCPRQILGYKSGEGIDICIAAHAERNLLNQCARLGISVQGTTLYMNANVLPCKECFLELIQCGVKEVVCVELNAYNDIEWLVEHSRIIIRAFYL